MDFADMDGLNVNCVYKTLLESTRQVDLLSNFNARYPAIVYLQQTSTSTSGSFQQN